MKNLLKQLSLKNILMLTLAGIVNSIGVTMFLTPVALYDSGISGTSVLLSQITPEWMSLSLFLVLLNVPLFLFGFKKQGAVFTVYAIYTVAVYSLSAFIINFVLPVDVSSSSPFAGTDLLLCAVFGGLISGLGSGLAIRYGGAMDGIEVMAVIFSKRLGITVGTFVMAYNALLYIVCGIVRQSFLLPLYSVIAYAVGLKAVDFLVEGLDRSKAATIITDHAQEICAILSEEFKCGITIQDGVGYYSGKPKKVVYMVLNRFQITRLRTLVLEIDPTAYITITDIADIFLKEKQ